MSLHIAISQQKGGHRRQSTSSDETSSMRRRWTSFDLSMEGAMHFGYIPRETNLKLDKSSVPTFGDFLR